MATTSRGEHNATERFRSSGQVGFADDHAGVNISIVLVTGADKGIGKEITRRLAQRGLTLYLGRPARRAAPPARG